MAYKVLYRKYRPQNFNDLYGQDSIKEILKDSIINNKLAHAYCFNGPRGTGKTSTAKLFAKAINCENAKDGIACGECNSCKNFNENPDIIEIDAASNNGVEEIRELRDNVKILPSNSKYKIYIIDEAEKMNPAAQNAILKTIEEPPSYVIIMLLTTNKGAFLPTILSRCILLNMKPISDKTIRKYLTEYGGISEETADFCTGFSMGNLGKAKAAAESEEFTEMRENAMSILRYLHEIQDYEIAEKVKILKKWKDSIDDYFDMMLIWFRDILIDKAIKNEQYLIFQSELTYIRKQSQQLSYEDINEIIREIGQTAKRIRANVNFDTSLEILHIDIKRRFFKENR